VGKLSNTVLVFLKAMSVCTVCFNVAYNVLGEMHSWEKTYPGSPAPDKTLFSVVYRTEFYLLFCLELCTIYILWKHTGVVGIILRWKGYQLHI
jgi:hypothetical protein